jgi:hypothetical protein
MKRTLDSRRSFKATCCSSGTPIAAEPELAGARVPVTDSERENETEGKGKKWRGSTLSTAARLLIDAEGGGIDRGAASARDGISHATEQLAAPWKTTTFPER